MWLALVGAALAHPFHNSFYGHELTLTVGVDAIRVEYRADIPTRDLWREVREVERKGLPTDTFAATRTAELRNGLSIAVDGARPALVEVVGDPPEVDERFARLHVVATAPIDPAVPHHIEIGNANAPEQIAYHRTTAHVARPWAVTATSIPPGKNGEWRLDEAGRALSVDVAPRSGLGALVLRVHPDPRGLRGADTAIATSAWDELAETWVPAAALAVALIVAVAFGWRGRRT